MTASSIKPRLFEALHAAKDTALGVVELARLSSRALKPISIVAGALSAALLVGGGALTYLEDDEGPEFAPIPAALALSAAKNALATEALSYDNDKREALERFAERAQIIEAGGGPASARVAALSMSEIHSLMSLTREAISRSANAEAELREKGEISRPLAAEALAAIEAAKARGQAHVPAWHTAPASLSLIFPSASRWAPKASAWAERDPKFQETMITGSMHFLMGSLMTSLMLLFFAIAGWAGLLGLHLLGKSAARRRELAAQSPRPIEAAAKPASARAEPPAIDAPQSLSAPAPLDDALPPAGETAPDRAEEEQARRILNRPRASSEL